LAVGPRNHWGYDRGTVSVEDAKLNALYWCAYSQKRNGWKPKPCAVYAINQKVVFGKISKVELKKIQERLNELGFNPGPIDGDWGSKTRRAMNAFLTNRGITPTQEIDEVFFTCT
jgi:hypothetical protein